MNVYTSPVSFYFFPNFSMKKSDAVRLRKQIQNSAKQGMPIAKIARKFGVSRPFVYAWMNEKITDDQRGWKKGKKRKYTDEQEGKIVEKRKELSDKFFSEGKRFKKNSTGSSFH